MPVILAMTSAPSAAREMEYGGVPPETDRPHGAQVLSVSVTFEMISSEGSGLSGMQKVELPSKEEM